VNARRDVPSEKPLIDKLDVKPGMHAALIGTFEEDFRDELAARAQTAEVPDAADMVFLGVEGPGDVARLGDLKAQIARDGAVWVVFRKGRKDFNENDVLRLGLESGMVDVKVVRFSDTHTALKFVIRKAER
jgi:hypothetical protein